VAATRAAALGKERIDLEDRVDKLTVRLAEVKSELSSVKKEKEEVEAIAARASQQVSLLEDRLTTTEANARTFAERAAEFAAVHQAEIKKLSSENKQLRERHVTFDALSVVANAGAKKTPAQAESAAIGELIKRIEFYEQQLAEADDTLAQAKASFMETGVVMRARIAELEGLLTEAQDQRSATLAAQGEEGLEIARLQAQLQKAAGKIEKLSEVMSRLELRAVEKNVEVTQLAAERDDAVERAARHLTDLNAATEHCKEAQAESRRLHETLRVLGNPIKLEDDGADSAYGY